MASEPDALLRNPFDKGHAEEPEQLVALPVCERRKRRLEHLIDGLVTLAKHCFAVWGESVSYRAPGSRDTLDHPLLQKPVGERTE